MIIKFIYLIDQILYFNNLFMKIPILIFATTNGLRIIILSDHYTMQQISWE
jgi:hypothetical protein